MLNWCVNGPLVGIDTRKKFKDFKEEIEKKGRFQN